MAGVKLYRTLWGLPEAADPSKWRAMFRAIADEGYRGVEVPAASPFFSFHGQAPTFTALRKEHGLDLIAQVHTLDYPVPAASWEAHAESLRAKAEEAAALEPELINVHGGKDSFRTADALRFFEAAVAVEEDVGVTMTHETHRQRIMCSPFAVRDLIAGMPAGVKLNADLSHFVVVLERLPHAELDAEFWPEVLAFVAERSHLIHARVGFAQGIQVHNPFAEEHTADLDAHLGWWKQIVAGMRRRGVVPRVEPEFGPYPYETHAPTVPLSDVNLNVANRLSTVL
eukprot:Rhum_TRINITY_DN226_c0_g1::Rhum_TRINITY_DN226_c0_g1_i1::g.839::m.839